MSATDVSTFAGEYPFRTLPHSGVRWLLSQMDRVGIDRAWVGHLSSPLRKDPAMDNAELVRVTVQHGDRLLPVPTVDPSVPRFRDDVRRARDASAPAIRSYPLQQGLDPVGSAMRELVAVAAEEGMPIVYTVRFEDSRQRHPSDRTPDLPAAAVRTLARLSPEVRILVTHAERSFVEEVHFGLTPDEAARLLWDISWVWGPPEDHLALLVETVGITRFTLGTGMPLRIPDAALAKLDLLDLPADQRARVCGGNLAQWSAIRP